MRLGCLNPKDAEGGYPKHFKAFPKIENASKEKWQLAGDRLEHPRKNSAFRDFYSWLSEIFEASGTLPNASGKKLWHPALCRELQKIKSSFQHFAESFPKIFAAFGTLPNAFGKKMKLWALCRMASKEKFGSFDGRKWSKIADSPSRTLIFDGFDENWEK